MTVLISASKRVISLVALLYGLLAGSAYADVVQKLYEASLPLESRQTELSQALVREGLRQVFVRVSGQTSIDTNAVIAEALANPQPFLSQYNFRRQFSDSEQVKLKLEMSFSPRQVNATLQSADLPVWSANRPSVLVWAMVDTLEGRRLLSAEEPSAVLDALQAEAYRRGLALQFPLLDLEDRSNLSVDALWMMVESEVRRASERYRPSYILMGKATELSSGSWLASWAVLEGELSQRLDAQGFDPREMLAPAIDLLADSQARQYALAGTAFQEKGNLIEVEGLPNFRDYAQMLVYLESLAVVQHANVVWAKGDRMVLDLVLKDSFSKAQRFLLLDGRLQLLSEQELSNTNSSSGLPVQARYQWRG